MKRWSLPGFYPAVERSCVGAGRVRLSDQPGDDDLPAEP